MRLVDAEPIEKWLLSHADQVPGKDPYKRARICAYRHAFEAVHSAPTVAAAYCYPAATQPPNDPLTWISVKHLPDLGSGRYLVWTRNSGVEICRWSEKQKKWIGGAWTAQITHWMPLPAPPEATP